MILGKTDSLVHLKGKERLHLKAERKFSAEIHEASVSHIVQGEV